MVMCYRDQTFCGSKTHKKECNKQVTKEVHEAAVRWWGNEDYPIALADFCGEDNEDD